jgi:hypothetical protein
MAGPIPVILPPSERGRVEQRGALRAAAREGGFQLEAGAGRGALIMRAKPSVVKGEPRSLTKTKGEYGPSPAEAGTAPAVVALDRVGARGAVMSNQSAIPGSGGSMPSAVAKALR